MIDEKKVREAIYCMKASIGETMCEECVNYYKCDHTKMDDMMRTAIEALEKQLPKKPQTSKAYYGCPDCTTIRSLRQKHNYCHNCGQRLDWSEKVNSELSN